LVKIFFLRRKNDTLITHIYIKGRVILFDDCLLECFIAINAIETISKSTYDPVDKSGLVIQRGETEKVFFHFKIF
jgi:hypothetical protein